MDISQEDITTYRRDGAVCLRSVVGTDWVERMHDASVDLLNRQRETYASTPKQVLFDTKTVEREPGRFFNGVFMNEESQDFREFVMLSPLPSVAARLMGSKVARFFYDQLFIKEPGTVSPTLWHNDMPFWPLTGSDLISCWVALTPTTKDSSGLEYVAGSHLWGKHYRATTPEFADEAMEPAPDFSDPANRDSHRFLSWDMEPGDVLFHHPLALHGAGGNKSLRQRRIGLSIRYIGADAQWAPRDKGMPLPRIPDVAPGAYPADDNVFPIAWQDSAIDRPA